MCLLMNLGTVGFINCQHKSHLSLVIEKGLEVWNVNFTEITKMEAKRTLQNITNRLFPSRPVVKDGFRKKYNILNPGLCKRHIKVKLQIQRKIITIKHPFGLFY